MATKKVVDKKITIDKLAQIINKGFEEQTKHFDKRFDDQADAINGRFDKVENDLKSIKTQLADVVHEPKFEKIEGRVDYLENIMAVKKD